MEELNLAHRYSQAKCESVQISYIKRVKLFSLFLPYNKHRIRINRAKSVCVEVWKNLDLGRVHRPHCVRSVLKTTVTIPPCRPPARLIRANN